MIPTKIHNEGKALLVGLLFILLLVNWMAWHFVGNIILGSAVGAISLVFFLLTLNFFRYPSRRNHHTGKEGLIIAPADGKVVVVEEVYEAELLKERCLKVSIFMSIFDVHINWPAVEGTVEHVSHTEGNFLKAFLPKSSTENERSAVIVRTPEGYRVLERQIAGAVARRIVTYLKEGQEVTVNDQLGFIKFGSRIDLYLPLGTVINVPIGTAVTGNTTILGKMPSIKLSKQPMP